MSTIESEHFNKALFILLDEAFDSVHGIFLDKGNSLFETLATIIELIKITPEWKDETEIAGAMGIVAHTAYHLGEIRQALCTLQA